MYLLPIMCKQSRLAPAPCHTNVPLPLLQFATSRRTCDRLQQPTLSFLFFDFCTKAPTHFIWYMILPCVFFSSGSANCKIAAQTAAHSAHPPQLVKRETHLTRHEAAYIIFTTHDAHGLIGKELNFIWRASYLLEFRLFRWVHCEANSSFRSQ